MTSKLKEIRPKRWSKKQKLKKLRRGGEEKESWQEVEEEKEGGLLEETGKAKCLWNRNV